MKAAIITEGRGEKREAAGSLHTPPLGLRDHISLGHGLALIAIALAFALTGLFGLVVAGGCFVIWMLWWFISGRQQAADGLIARGTCACCEYEIAGLPIEPDGCVVCPECGAAWKVHPAAEASGAN